MCSTDTYCQATPLEVLFGTGCKFITISENGKQSGCGGNCVATVVVDAVVAEAADSLMIGALGVGIFASEADVGNGVLRLVEVEQHATMAGSAA